MSSADAVHAIFSDIACCPWTLRHAGAPWNASERRKGGPVNIRQDTILGTFFVIVGLTAFLIALQYPIGTANRMGPGYFPVIVSAMLGLTGAAILLRGRIGATALVDPARWKPVA